MKWREWYLNPVVGYKCEVNEDGIGLSGNEVHVIEYAAYEELKKELVNVDYERNVAASERDELQAQINRAADQITELRRQLAASIEERDAVVAALGQMRTKCDTAEAERDWTEKVYHMNRDYVEDTKAENAKLQAEVEQLKSRMQDHLPFDAYYLEWEVERGLIYQEREKLQLMTESYRDMLLKAGRTHIAPDEGTEEYINGYEQACCDIRVWVRKWLEAKK